MSRLLRAGIIAVVLVTGTTLYAAKDKVGDSKKPAVKEKRSKKQTLSAASREYAFPSTDKVMEDARLAIEFLGKNYRSYKSKAYLKELDALAARNASIEEIDQLRYKALVLNNPEVNFDKILFRSSKSAKFPSNWQGNSTFLRSGGKENQPDFNDAFQLLDLKNKSVKTLYRPESSKEGLMDICLSFSGRKFLYSGIDAESNTFQVYEMNIDGSDLRNLTGRLDSEDTEPCYLPNGRIAFTSSRAGRLVQCGDWALACGRAPVDGPRARVTINPRNATTPSLLVLFMDLLLPGTCTPSHDTQ